MPSQALQDLSAQIEQQQTDNFGKFYLYATLLNTMTVRKKSFLAAMPVYQSVTSTVKSAVQNGLNTIFYPSVGLVFTPADEDCKIKTGAIDSTFYKKLTDYAEQYANPVPNVVRVSLEIFWTFLRRGKLNDLLFVIQKMDAHLNTSSLAAPAYNQGIYMGIAFKERQENVRELLTHARWITKHAQDAVDSGALTVATVIAAIVALKFTMAFGGILLSLTMLTAGACTAYYFIQSAIESFNQIETAANNCEQLCLKMTREQEENLYSPNNLNFIIKGIMAPITYTGVTVREQMQTCEAEAQATRAERKRIDNQYQEIENRSSISYVLS